jgi:3-oxoisoapionate kinase
MQMKPLLTFYGDDFTGASAVLEILAHSGVSTVMFLDVPSPAILSRLDGIQAFGIAGIARSKSPDWMSAELPRYLEALKVLGAPVLHYKTCSTFDSAPHLGSIGRAIEVGLAVTGSAWSPLVVGAPAIGRYQIFGTLFAALDGVAYRLDRHPVMARHPATPMTEADLCRHLDAQTSLRKCVIDWRALISGQADDEVRAARALGARIIALDVFDEATLQATGRVIWEAAQNAPVFAAGSQGVEYALVAHWRQAGLLAASLPAPPLLPADPVLVVSGSCSQITARQVDTAQAGGFLILPLDARQAISSRKWDRELMRVDAEVQEALARGRNTLVCTARGPDDPAIAALNEAIASSRADSATVHARIGNGLGRLVRRARLQQGLRRVVFSGGDTSGHAMLAVGAQAMVPVASIAQGVPLLRIHSSDPAFDGMEIALKGGQMGDAGLFMRAALGSP